MSAGGLSQVFGRQMPRVFSGPGGSGYVMLQPGTRLNRSDINLLTAFVNLATPVVPREEPRHNEDGPTEQSIFSQLKTRDPDLGTKKKKKKNVHDDICAVCQEDLDREDDENSDIDSDREDDEKIAILECGHEYHGKCVATWLVRNKSCPVCRADVKLL